MMLVTVLGIGFGACGWTLLRRRLQRRREAYIRDFDFAALLDTRLARQRSSLSPLERQRVLAGLRQYFLICHDARTRFVAMPSQVVDEAWHEFILFTRNYAAFCSKAFGRMLHHTPAEALRAPALASEGIRRAWRLACAREGIDPKLPRRLPLLFALDAALAIPDGFYYTPDCKQDSNAGYCAGDIGCGGGGSSCGGDAAGDGGSSGDGGGGCGGGCGGGGGD